MLAICKFILALITTLSSTTFRFRVNREKLNPVMTRFLKGENSYSRFTRKQKVIELRVVKSVNINMPIPVILSLKSSLYDLQKLRYEFSMAEKITRDENGFSRFTRKRKVVELRFVISAYIKSPFAVIMHPKTSLYDLQKLRYEFLSAAMHKNGFSPITRKQKVGGL